jgi:hypothetical protein
MPGTSAAGGVAERRQVTFMVLRRSHGPYVIGSSVRPVTMPSVTHRFPATLIGDQGPGMPSRVLAGWMRLLGPMTHSRITREDQQLLSADRRNEPWLSPMLQLIPAPLRSQLEIIANGVARERAQSLHAHLIQDARVYIGNAVDYLTPRDVRNDLSVLAVPKNCAGSGNEQFSCCVL